MYIDQAGAFGRQGNPHGPNGLVTLNVSQIQHRVPNPKVSVISTLFWNDSNIAQETLPVTYNGKNYLVTTDELGSGALVSTRAGACARGLSPYGFARIINVNSPKDPFIVSKLRLQVDSPAKCDVDDDAPESSAFGYDTHYCNVNRTTDPTMLGCGQFESGLRLYDIANPSKPSEIGYFSPPPGHATASEHGTAGEATGRIGRLLRRCSSGATSGTSSRTTDTYSSRSSTGRPRACVRSTRGTADSSLQ